MKTNIIRMVSLFALLALILAGCSAGGAGNKKADFPDELYTDSLEITDIQKEEIPLSAAPVSTLMMPSADGEVTYSQRSAVIDASNTDDGYVMIKYEGTSKAKLKVIITGPSGLGYTYNLKNNGEYEVFPLSDSSGSYKIGVYENIAGSKYATLFTKTLSVELKDELAPFLLPNQYVNYTADSEAVVLAEKLMKDADTELSKLEKIYAYVIKNIKYDKEKAKTVQSGYLPDIDEILKEKKGICFDYASLMAAMLRSGGVATKLVVGYTGDVYHAWLNVYTKESGWIDGAVFFDGKEWKLMDPTFASTGHSSDKIMAYIGNGKNYSAKYLY